MGLGLDDGGDVGWRELGVDGGGGWEELGELGVDGSGGGWEEHGVDDGGGGGVGGRTC